MNISFGGGAIGDGEPCFIVAEAGENHNGSVDLACALVEQAAAAGADAVKFQTITRAELYNSSHPRFAHRSSVELPLRDYPRLIETARKNNIIFFSTPFDEPSADFLDELGVPLFKIGSGELTHHSLLRHVAKKGKPMIISTGAAELEWIDTAVQVVKDAGNDQIIIAHCISVYPALAPMMNLRAIPALRERLGVPVGFSDHTISIQIPVAAVALGACLVEKHFTLSRALPEGDNDMSAEPNEFQSMVQGIKEVEQALGTGHRSVLPEEQPILAAVRRGIYARSAIKKGQIILPNMLAVRRPISEIPADRFDNVVGRTAMVEIAEEEALRWDQFES